MRSAPVSSTPSSSFLCPSTPASGSFGRVGWPHRVWLQWIHGDALQVRSWAFVTPSYHGVHHLRPHKNFGHVLRLWDWLAGTEECDYGEKKGKWTNMHCIVSAPGL